MTHNSILLFFFEGCVATDLRSLEIRESNGGLSVIPFKRQIFFLADFFESLVINILAIIITMSSCWPACALVPVPAVSCIGDLVPPPSSLPSNNNVSVDLPNSTAAHLQMYIFSTGMMLGPRGWYCQTFTDGFEGTVAILPNDKTNSSYGITEVFVDGTSDAHTEQNMEGWVLTYFPNEMKRQVQSGNKAREPIATHKYSTDLLDRISPFLLTYTTPAGHAGIGSHILLRFGYGSKLPYIPATMVPIGGFLKLITRPYFGASQIDLFAIAMPKQFEGLTSYIQTQAQTLN